jgi:TNF receptor-associated factor 4
VETCGFMSIDCPNGCGIRFEKRFMNKHQAEDCPKRTVVCEFCKINYFIINRVIHKICIFIN